MPQHPITQLLKRSALHVLGINTGTSIDGLDLALVEVSGGGQRRKVRLLHTGSYPFPRSIQDTLHRLAGAERVDKRTVAAAHYRLGELIAESVIRFRKDLSRPVRIDLIGSHGQTIGHFPNAPGRGGRKSSLTSATWQIGSSAVIARQTGIVTVGDFRAGDIASGGMGAPLSGFYHCLMFGANRVVLNIGGIANISAVRGRGPQFQILAFDIGPGNMVIDAIATRVLARRFDRDGKVAASGTPDPRILARARQHPYFRRRPPKTCGREEFGDATVRAWLGRRTTHRAEAPDLLASAIAVTTDAVVRAVRRWVEPFTPHRSMILTGGGTKNQTLVGALQEGLPDWEFADSGHFGIPAQYVEPVGFAILANETIRARPGNRGGATGGMPAVLGSVSLP